VQRSGRGRRDGQDSGLEFWVVGLRSIAIGCVVSDGWFVVVQRSGLPLWGKVAGLGKRVGGVELGMAWNGVESLVWLGREDWNRVQGDRWIGSGN
jgi:hypothetical protein